MFSAVLRGTLQDKPVQDVRVHIVLHNRSIANTGFPHIFKKPFSVLLQNLFVTN